MRTIVALLVLLVATPCLADSLLLTDESTLGFVSVKNVDGAEAHSIARLTGSLNDAGGFAVDIHLDSVDIQVPIRDERMRGMLFDTETYPLARVTGSIDAGLMDGLSDGGTTVVAVPGEQPFCDGSHKGSEYEPVAFEADRQRYVYFCGCKQTASAPLCDMSHRDLKEVE